MTPLGAFLRLPMPEKTLALEAAMCLGLARLVVRHVPMRHWRGWLNAGRAASGEPAGGTAPARIVGRMVRKVASRLPFEAACLPRALAAHWMLRRRRVDSRVVLGVRRRAGGATDYHAWLTANGKCIVGGPADGRYTPLFTSAPAPGRRTEPEPPRPASAARDGARRARRTFHGARELAGALYAHAPRRCLLVAGLLLVSAVTETFGIALLVPLLALAGLDGGGAGASRLRDLLESGAAALGVGLTLPLLLAVFVVLVAVRSAVAWQRHVQLAAIRHGFTDRLRERLYAAAANAEWRFLVGRRRSDVEHVLTRDVGRAGAGATQMVQAAVAAALVPAQAALAVAISPTVSLGMLLVGAALLAAGHPLVRRARRLGQRLTDGGRGAHAAMTGFLDGLKQAKSEDAAARHVGDYVDALGGMRRHQIDFARASAATEAVFQVGGPVAVAGLAWLALGRAGLGTPELLVMGLVAGRVLPALRRVQRGAQHVAHALPAWRHAMEMERALLDAAEAPADAAAGPMPLRRRLAVRGVSFGYGAPGAEGPALHEVDLVIPAGRFVAVAGPSGAGKSTLLDLLLGLMEPDAGEIRVDGLRLSGAVRRRWRGSVACVPQEPCLLHETVRANLARARPGAAEADLWRALGRAGAGFVSALPDGLETVAGDRGARLSGGERQRIALARALLREPALLVLDEPTSQLDAEAERQVLAALRSLRGETTVVAATHRRPVMEAADHVVLLEAGRVAAAGPWRAMAPRDRRDGRPAVGIGETDDGSVDQDSRRLGYRPDCID